VSITWAGHLPAPLALQLAGDGASALPARPMAASFPALTWRDVVCWGVLTGGVGAADRVIQMMSPPESGHTER
jgi:hypothetical protein